MTPQHDNQETPDPGNKGLSRRAFITQAGFAVGAVAWAACGGSSATSTTAAGSGTTAGTTATTAASGGGSTEPLTFWHMDFETHRSSFGRLIEGFTAETGIEIQTSPQPPAEQVAKYQQAFLTGTEPDLVALHGNFISSFLAAGVLAPLSQGGFSPANLQSTFFSSLLESYTYNGEVYGIPLAGNTPGIGMVVNVDHFEEAGIEIPVQFESWAQVWEIAQALTQTSASGEITRAGLVTRESHMMQYVGGFMLEQGAQYFDADAGTFAFDQPAGHRAIQTLVDAVATHKVDTPNIPRSRDSLGNGQASMGMIFVDYIPLARAQFPDKNFTFVLRPPLEGDTLIVASEGPWGVQVTERSERKEEAFAFLQYLAREQSLQSWYQEQNAPPATPALAQDPWLSTPEGSFLNNVVKTMGTWVDMGSYPKAEINIFLAWPILESAIVGEITAEDAARQIDEEANAAMEQYRADVAALQG